MKIDQKNFSSMEAGAAGDSPRNGALSEISRLRIASLLDEIQARAPGIPLSAAAIAAAWLDEAAWIKATRCSATIAGLIHPGGNMGDFALSLKIGYNDPVIWAIAEAMPGSGPGPDSRSAMAGDSQVLKTIEKIFSKRDFGASSAAGAMALTSYFSEKPMPRGGWRLFLHDNIGQTFDIRIRPLTRRDKLVRGAVGALRRLLSWSTIDRPEIDRSMTDRSMTDRSMTDRSMTDRSMTDGAPLERHNIDKTRGYASGACRRGKGSASARDRVTEKHVDEKTHYRVSCGGESWSGAFEITKTPSGDTVVSVRPELHRRALAAAALSSAAAFTSTAALASDAEKADKNEKE